MSLFMITMGLAILLHDVESTFGNWYLDKNLSHMREECKTKLKSQFDTECKRIGGEFTKFNVCNIQCKVQNGNHVKFPYVFLKNDLPCGPYGEKCKEGLCYGPCDVQFFNLPRPRSDDEINRKKRDAK
uniref:Putative ixostatin n=1 Tax=Ixodes ricinus TaxID=34613 RepID=A0A0K8RMH5_IXORI